VALGKQWEEKRILQDRADGEVPVPSASIIYFCFIAFRKCQSAPREEGWKNAYNFLMY
jgi:hypothetical protein